MVALSSLRHDDMSVTRQLTLEETEVKNISMKVASALATSQSLQT